MVGGGLFSNRCFQTLLRATNRRLRVRITFPPPPIHCCQKATGRHDSRRLAASVVVLSEPSKRRNKVLTGPLEDP